MAFIIERYDREVRVWSIVTDLGFNRFHSRVGAEGAMYWLKTIIPGMYRVGWAHTYHDDPTAIRLKRDTRRG